VIAQSLRRARAEAGLSREQLGELVGVADKAVAAYEGETARLPRRDVLERMVEAFRERGVDWFADVAAGVSRTRRAAGQFAGVRRGAQTSETARRRRSKARTKARRDPVLRRRLERLAAQGKVRFVTGERAARILSEAQDVRAAPRG
jgi:transcriptional regulator with XRE-family HTH domain